MRDQPWILCVDDEDYVLEGLRDVLRPHFKVHTAQEGLEGLNVLRTHAGKFAIVISDMRMPAMSGADFMRMSEPLAPDASRILLTGAGDLREAIRVVNSAHIFRFLTKPCGPEDLRQACAAALEQHHIKVAERQLLEETLRGSVNALLEALAVVSPAAFGRSRRVALTAAKLAAVIGLPNWWEVEMAAALADLGMVSLLPETVEKVYSHQPLTVEESELVERVPQTTRRLLAKIPRMDGVLSLLDHYYERPPEERGKIPAAAQVLRLVTEFDDLVSEGAAEEVAMGVLHSRGEYGPSLLDAFASVRGLTSTTDVVEVSCAGLCLGMMLVDDVRSPGGDLLVARGQPITDQLMVRLRLMGADLVREPLRVLRGNSR